MKADPERDLIEVDGVAVCGKPECVYLMLNKPRGYVTTLSDEKGRPTAAQLVSGCGARVWPVGRLDMYSEGLLLFSNDGAFTQRMMHPSGEVEKEYLVRVDHCTEAELNRLRGPIMLDGVELAPAQVRVRSKRKDSVLLQFVIHEGKNRQIRRMCEQAGIHVLRLKRIREGKLSLGSLPTGKWRYLTTEECKLF